MDKAKVRIEKRKKRAFGIRKKVFGYADRPRLCVNRSLKHICAQIINDETGVTLAHVVSFSKDLRDQNITKTQMAETVGKLIAQKASEKGITSVVFDRNGFPYHGRVKALAEAARKNGLQF